MDERAIKINFWEWLFKEVEVKDVSHLDKKFDQSYMTTPVFESWLNKLLEEKANDGSQITF
jgi:hypothetical protein